MSYFPNLDETTRLNMIAELEKDCRSGKFYEPSSIQKAYIPIYKSLLKKSFENGNVETLQKSILPTYFRLTDRNGRKMPTNIAQMLSFSDFNRYYVRAILARAISEGRNVAIYRAKYSIEERKESKSMIGKCYFDKGTLENLLVTISDYRLLFSSRSNVDFMKPNSGLSLRFV